MRNAVVLLEHFERQINAACQHEAQRIQQQLIGRRLWNEAHRPRIDRAGDDIGRFRCGQHDHRHCGIPFAQLRQCIEPVYVGQAEIEEDQIEIRIGIGHRHRFGAILSLEQHYATMQHTEHVMQRFADQRVIVDDQNLHHRLQCESGARRGDMTAIIAYSQHRRRFTSVSGAVPKAAPMLA
jgi:hypothetical protein